MELWLGLVVVAQIMLAFVALIDKYIVTSDTVVLRPFTYTFWISILSAGSIVVYLFSWIPIPIDGFAMPSFKHIQPLSLTIFALALTTGYAFFAALLSMFTALKDADASDVVPVVGGLSAVFTFWLSYAFLGTTLPTHFLYGFVMLVLGTILVSTFRFSWRTTLSVSHAGLMFGVHYVAIKALMNATNFDTAFFWSRTAIVMVALSMLLIPYYYDKVRERTRSVQKRDGGFLIGNKILGGIASILMLKATELGDVTLVQALGGLQYLVLLAFSACCGRFISKDWGENVTTRDIVQKTLSVPLIVLGFFLLFVGT
jgi:uncharacterized membrane protein